MSRLSGVGRNQFSPEGWMQRASKRLAAQEFQTQKAEKRWAHKRRIDDLGEPRKCKDESCSRQARHRGSWCQTCFDQHFVNKTTHPVLCQGCPSFLGRYTHDRIRWSRFRSAISSWIEINLELVETRPSKHIPPWIEIAGWKGGKTSMSQGR